MLPVTNWLKKKWFQDSVRFLCVSLKCDHWQISRHKNVERILFLLYFQDIKTLKEYCFCYIFKTLKRWKNTVFAIFSITNFTPFKSKKISCLFLSGSSHDIVDSSRYIPCDCLLNFYVCWISNIYLNMQIEISQFTIFTKCSFLLVSYSIQWLNWGYSLYYTTSSIFNAGDCHFVFIFI